MIDKMRAWQVGAVAEIERQCFADPWSEAMIAESGDNGLDTYLVLEEEGGVRGYCVYRTIAGEGELLRIGVLLKYRGLGYAKKLMDEMVLNSRENQVSAISLEVREGNLAARNLYKTYGFLEESVRKDYYRNPQEDAIIMWNRRI